MFKKLWNAIKSIFEGIGGDIAVDQASDLIEGALEKFYESNPKEATALVQSFYAFSPSLIELAAKTKTNIDDKLASELTEDIIKFAALKGIDLPELPTAAKDGGGSNPEPDGDD